MSQNCFILASADLRNSYWEWEVESEDPIHSTFFDPTNGFGGDGNLSGPFLSQEESLKTIDENRCIMDGPFKDFRPQYYGVLPLNGELDIFPEYNPHCITRGFTEAFKRPKAHPAEFPPIGFSQGAVAELMGIDVYEDFNLAAEAMHAWLPVSLGGDYMALSAPNGKS